MGVQRKVQPKREAEDRRMYKDNLGLKDVHKIFTKGMIGEGGTERSGIK